MRYVVVQQNNDGIVVCLITKDRNKAKRKAEKVTHIDAGMFGYVLTYNKPVPNKELKPLTDTYDLEDTYETD